jgi:hypothetical protein
MDQARGICFFYFLPVPPPSSHHAWKSSVGTRILILWGPWIQEGKNGPQKLKKVIKFHVFKCWMFSFKDEGISCSLDFLYEGQGISKLQF